MSGVYTTSALRGVPSVPHLEAKARALHLILAQEPIDLADQIEHDMAEAGLRRVEAYLDAIRGADAILVAPKPERPTAPRRRPGVCRSCAAPLPAQVGRSRPRVYCGQAACRRLGQAEDARRRRSTDAADRAEAWRRENAYVDHLNRNLAPLLRRHDPTFRGWVTPAEERRLAGFADRAVRAVLPATVLAGEDDGLFEGMVPVALDSLLPWQVRD